MMTEQMWKADPNGKCQVRYYAEDGVPVSMWASPVDAPPPIDDIDLEGDIADAILRGFEEGGAPWPMLLRR